MGKYKPRASTEEKRREILLVASDVFGKKGTSNATLEEIAARVITSGFLRKLVGAF